MKESDGILLDIDIGDCAIGDPGSRDITSGSFLSSGFINIFEKGDNLSKDSACSSFLRVADDLSIIVRVLGLIGEDISMTSGSGAVLFLLYGLLTYWTVECSMLPFIPGKISKFIFYHHKVFTKQKHKVLT